MRDALICLNLMILINKKPNTLYISPVYKNFKQFVEVLITRDDTSMDQWIKLSKVSTVNHNTEFHSYKEKFKQNGIKPN